MGEARGPAGSVKFLGILHLLGRKIATYSSSLTWSSLTLIRTHIVYLRERMYFRTMIREGSWKGLGTLLSILGMPHTTQDRILYFMLNVLGSDTEVH